MSAMKAAMKRAGIHTAQSELREMAAQAWKKHHGKLDRVAPTLAAQLISKGDPELIAFAIAPYVEQISAEMLGGGQAALESQTTSAGAGQPNRDGAGSPIGVAQTSHARPARDSAPGRSRRGFSVITSTQSTTRQGLLYQIKTSDGRAWATIGYHELDGMDRDGAIARIIKRRVGVPPNRFMPLSEILTDATFKEVIDEARKQNDPA